MRVGKGKRGRCPPVLASRVHVRRCASEDKLPGAVRGSGRGGSVVRALVLSPHTRRLSTPPDDEMVKFARAEREIWRGACGLVREWSVAVPQCVSRRNTRTSDAHWKCKIDTFWQENDARGLPKFCVERHTKGRSRSTRTPGHTHHANFSLRTREPRHLIIGRRRETPCAWRENKSAHHRAAAA